MKLSSLYNKLLNKAPRRTNECWLGDMYEGKEIYVYGHKFLAHLEGTAIEIWLLMDGHRNMREIVELLVKKYDYNNPEVILEDTIGFILHLERSGVAAWRSRPLFENVEIDD